MSRKPEAGQEPAGRRPTLVGSPAELNRRVDLALMCPIMNKEKGHPFEVALPDNLKTSGVVLSDQVKSLDWRARVAKIADVAPETTTTEVLGKSNAPLSCFRTRSMPDTSEATVVERALQLGSSIDESRTDVSRDTSATVPLDLLLVPIGISFAGYLLWLRSKGEMVVGRRRLCVINVLALLMAVSCGTVVLESAIAAFVSDGKRLVVITSGTVGLGSPEQAGALKASNPPCK
jgi:mRNA interferase MazF